MLKKKWFTKENFEKNGMDIEKEYTLPSFIRIIRDSSKSDGNNFGLKVSADLVSQVRQKWNDVANENTLFYETYTKDGNTYYKVNKMFDWISYETNFKQPNSANPVNDELSLLRSIAAMLTKSYKKPNGLFSSDIPIEVSSALTIWNEKYR